MFRKILKTQPNNKIFFQILAEIPSVKQHQNFTHMK